MRRAAAILQAAYTAIGLAVAAALTALVAQPAVAVYFLLGGDKERKRLRYHAFICRMARLTFKCIPGVRLVYDNAAGETFDRPAIIICNHQSMLDLLCVLMLSPRIVVLTNDWVWRNPALWLLIRRAEFYPVADGLETNLERLRGLTERGYSAVVFPEGTRSADGEIQRFHKGAFYLAERLRLDIIPVIIHGADKTMKKKALTIRPGTIRVVTAPRVAPDDTAYGDGYRQRTSGFRRYYIRRYAEIGAADSKNHSKKP